ncbi:MAG: radical SAM protein [Ignisphaera sp.]
MVKTRLIRPFDPWRSPLCTCPPKWSLNPYTGCGHGCLYCYASSYIPRFYSPRVKRGVLETVYRDSLALPLNSIVELSPSSDPFQPLDDVYGYSPKIVEALVSRGHRILITTKGVSILMRYTDVFERYRDRVAVAITITTLDGGTSRVLEPGAPPPMDRVYGARELSRRGIYVTVRIDPIIPGVNDDIEQLSEMVGRLAEAGVKQITVSTYKARYDSLKRLVAAFPDREGLLKELYIGRGERIHGYLYLPQQIRYRYMVALKDVVERHGLGFATCREGFPQLHTQGYTCDGTTPFYRVEQTV